MRFDVNSARPMILHFDLARVSTLAFVKKNEETT